MSTESGTIANYFYTVRKGKSLPISFQEIIRSFSSKELRLAPCFQHTGIDDLINTFIIDFSGALMMYDESL